MNNPAGCVSVNNVFEAAYRAAGGPELGVPDGVFGGVVDSGTLDLFAGEEVLEVIP